jgi:hypothetical protein
VWTGDNMYACHGSNLKCTHTHKFPYAHVSLLLHTFVWQMRDKHNLSQRELNAIAQMRGGMNAWLRLSAHAQRSASLRAQSDGGVANRIAASQASAAARAAATRAAARGAGAGAGADDDTGVGVGLGAAGRQLRPRVGVGGAGGAGADADDDADDPWVLGRPRMGQQRSAYMDAFRAMGAEAPPPPPPPSSAGASFWSQRFGGGLGIDPID